MLLINIFIFLLLFLFIFLILIILVPFVYETSGDSNDMKLAFKVTWLFSLMGFSGNYRPADGMNFTFYILGMNIPLDKGDTRDKATFERQKSARQKIKKKGDKEMKSFRYSLIDWETFRYIYCNFKKLLKHLLPRKVEARGVLGFEDPYYTGVACSLLEILRGFRFHDIQIHYNFYDEVCEGTFYLLGRINLIYIVYIAMRLLLNKSVRKLVFQ